MIDLPEKRGNNAKFVKVVRVSGNFIHERTAGPPILVRQNLVHFGLGFRLRLGLIESVKMMRAEVSLSRKKEICWNDPNKRNTFSK